MIAQAVITAAKPGTGAGRSANGKEGHKANEGRRS
jgi:hypothetical protein